jgi:hypothetical protein
VPAGWRKSHWTLQSSKYGACGVARASLQSNSDHRMCGGGRTAGRKYVGGKSDATQAEVTETNEASAERRDYWQVSATGAAVTALQKRTERHSACWEGCRWYFHLT